MTQGRRDVAVIIPAGGAGLRFGGRTPKQFRRLGPAPILVTTVRHFVGHPSVREVVVAAPEAYVATARRLLTAARARSRVSVVAGGATRQESIWRALEATSMDAAMVLVHDAVRPLITRALIDRVLEAARETGGAICALPIAETVKRVEGDRVQATVDRAGLWAVQTPQGFRASLLREAHDKARRDAVTGTDDSMLVERLGHAVKVVPGLPGNVKITTPDDLRRARALSR
jgi:2-C-methyl-D-erythritol 4-phosphate cytidylyltransferase